MLAVLSPSVGWWRAIPSNILLWWNRPEGDSGLDGNSGLSGNDPGDGAGGGERAVALAVRDPYGDRPLRT
jgi:hypothetical protein